MNESAESIEPTTSSNEPTSDQKNPRSLEAHRAVKKSKLPPGFSSQTLINPTISADKTPIQLHKNTFSEDEQEVSSIPEITSLNTPEYSAYLWDKFSSLTPEEILPLLRPIAERFQTEIDKAIDERPNTRIFARNIGILTTEIVNKLATSKHHDDIDPKALETLYEYIKNENIDVRTFAGDFLESVIRLDEGNGDVSLGLSDRLLKDVVEKTVSGDGDMDWQIAKELIRVVKKHFPDRLGSFLVASIEATDDSQILTEVFAEYSERMGFNEAREALLEGAREDPLFAKKLNGPEKITELIPHEKARIYADQDEFYLQMDEDNYPSYSREFNKNFILSHTTPEDEWLDQGAGTGDLAEDTAKERKVRVTDISPNHIKRIKDRIKGIDARCVSWDKTTWEDGEIDVESFLGRSFSSCNTLAKCEALFRESSRILKDDGKIYLDIADANSPFYRNNIKDMEERLGKLGITNWLRGSVIDSPNNQDFTDRFLPSHDQMVAIARLNGFNAEIVATNEYEAPNGEKATNLYYELTKSKESLSEEEYSRTLRVAMGIEEEPVKGQSEYDQEFKIAA